MIHTLEYLACLPASQPPAAAERQNTPKAHSKICLDRTGGMNWSANPCNVSPALRPPAAMRRRPHRSARPPRRTRAPPPPLPAALPAVAGAASPAGSAAAQSGWAVVGNGHVLPKVRYMARA